MFPVTKISTNVHIDSKSSRPPFEKKGHTKYKTHKALLLLLHKTWRARPHEENITPEILQANPL